MPMIFSFCSCLLCPQMVRWGGGRGSLGWGGVILLKDGWSSEINEWQREWQFLSTTHQWEPGNANDSPPTSGQSRYSRPGNSWHHRHTEAQSFSHDVTMPDQKLGGFKGLDPRSLWIRQLNRVDCFCSGIMIWNSWVLFTLKFLFLFDI